MVLQKQKKRKRVEEVLLFLFPIITRREEKLKVH